MEANPILREMSRLGLSSFQPSSEGEPARPVAIFTLTDGTRVRFEIAADAQQSRKWMTEAWNRVIAIQEAWSNLDRIARD